MPSSYKDTWDLIGRSLQKFFENQISSAPNDDDYFEEKPFYQEFLTDKDMTFPYLIEYSNYTQENQDKINIRNLFECFHGILFYIFYYSNNKFNVEEIEFHFSGAQTRQPLESILSNTNLNQINQWDILNIFYYEDTTSQFRINCTINAFIGFTFKRIKVKPLAYSIRSGSFPNISTHLISFVFEGYDELENKWDLLDERVNINDLIPSGGYCMFYVHTTDKSYSSFRVRQTEPGSTGFWGFSIAALEIHGTISLLESAFRQDQSLAMNESDQSLNFNDAFNPNMDMSDYIL